MSTFDILAKFLEMYPQFHECICHYAPVGSNTIIVWFRNGQVFDFTYFTDQKWHLVKHRNFNTEYIGRYMR